MNKKNLLITSGIIMLSLLKVTNVQAEKANDIEIVEIEKNIIHNTEEITSKTSIGNQSTQVENTDESSNDRQIVFNEIIKELNTLLNSKQKEILNHLISEENEVYSLFKEAVIAHQTGEFDQAVVIYDEIEDVFLVNNEDTTLFVDLLNSLATKQIYLLNYEYINREDTTGTVEDEESPELKNPEQAEEDNVKPDTHLSTFNVQSTQQTPEDLYNQILNAKSVTAAWNLAEEFKTNYPNHILLAEAVNHAAQLNLNYGIKVHKRGEYADAASYYERVVNAALVSNNLKTTAQAYLNQANSDKELTTPANYYEQVLNAKSVSGAWNLIQEFKTNFPQDALLGEAVNHAAQLNLNYGIKVHKRGEYADAASYYEKVVNEALVSNNLKTTAQGYLNQANSDQELKTPVDYHEQILNAKSVTGAWNLTQEFKTNFPQSTFLNKSMDHAAQLHLNYGMKLHDQENFTDAIAYYNRILSEDLVSNNLKSTTLVYLNQADAKQALTTPTDYFEQILGAKSVSNAWSLAEKFKADFPQSVLLSEAINHAALLHLNYGMKLHNKADFSNAIYYYNRVLNADLVSNAIKSRAQIFLNQANSNHVLKTPRDYYNQILSAKGVSSAWSLSQELKVTFPNDALLSAAINHAAEVNLQYAIKLHNSRSFLQAAEYYNRIVSEELVNASTKNMARAFSNLAGQRKEIPSANSYATQITSSRSASGAWNLSQEALLIFPNHSALINALNKTANDNLSYGRKLHKQGSVSLARPYYEKVSNDTRVSSQIRDLANLFLKQTNADNKPVIYIDSGHGGSDSGASFSGVHEKRLNLNVSNYLKAELEKRGYSVIMSRESDVFVGLTERAVEANNLGVDIFVSVHHNSMGGAGTVRGIETFIFHKVASGFGQEVNRNNFNLDDPRINESVVLADQIHNNLIRSTGLYNRGVKGNNFNVLRNTHIPAVLLELGFMDNPSELARINTSYYQRTSAQAIASGIDNYFSTINK